MTVLYYETGDYLEHHGIKGQKWGVRRFQRKDGSRTSAGKRRETQNRDLKTSQESDSMNKKGLSEKQKRFIKIGIAVTATTIAAYGAYKLAKSGKFDKFVKMGQSIVDGNDKTKAHTNFITNGNSPYHLDHGFKVMNTPEPLSETLIRTNPNRGKPEYANNCTSCGIASFLRTKGYDVEATDVRGRRQNLGGVVEECFKNIDRKNILDGSAVKFGRSIGDAETMLKKRFGDNASGVVGVKWKNTNAGHTFNWSIANGIVTFFDGQTNSPNNDTNTYWRFIDPNGGLTIARLDNLEINFEGILKYVKKH